MASTISVIESAPPDTAHVTSVPGGGNVHLAEQVRAWPGRCQATSAPTRSSHSRGLRISSKEGRFVGLPPAHVDGPWTTVCLDRGDEPFAGRVLVELAFDAGQSQHQPG